MRLMRKHVAADKYCIRPQLVQFTCIYGHHYRMPCKVCYLCGLAMQTKRLLEQQTRGKQKRCKSVDKPLKQRVLMKDKGDEAHEDGFIKVGRKKKCTNQIQCGMGLVVHVAISCNTNNTAVRVSSAPIYVGRRYREVYLCESTFQCNSMGLQYLIINIQVCFSMLK